MDVIVIKPETVEEKIRNKITPMYNFATLIKDHMSMISDKHVSDYMLKLCNDTANSILENCKSLIKIGEVVDRHLPDDFNINNYEI